MSSVKKSDRVSQPVAGRLNRSGRKKGVPNKTTASVKQALSLAFEGIGGVPRLKAWAEENQTEFFKLWAKMLPTDVEISGKDGGPIHLFVFGGQKVPF